MNHDTDIDLALTGPASDLAVRAATASAPLLTSENAAAPVRYIRPARPWILRSYACFGVLAAISAAYFIAKQYGHQPADHPAFALVILLVLALFAGGVACQWRAHQIEADYSVAEDVTEGVEITEGDVLALRAAACELAGHRSAPIEALPAQPAIEAGAR